MKAAEIEKVAKTKGADLVGFADVSKFPGGEDNKLNPRYYLPDAKTVIVMGFNFRSMKLSSLNLQPVFALFYPNAHLAELRSQSLNPV